jgi:hypothetical protein
VSLSEEHTAPLQVVLGVNNVFGVPAGTSGLSAAHGWVALLNALPVGTHKIVIHLVSTDPTLGDQTFTTIINVVP